MGVFEMLAEVGIALTVAVIVLHLQASFRLQPDSDVQFVRVAQAITFANHQRGFRIWIIGLLLVTFSAILFAIWFAKMPQLQQGVIATALTVLIAIFGFGAVQSSWVR